MWRSILSLFLCLSFLGCYATPPTTSAPAYPVHAPENIRTLESMTVALVLAEDGEVRPYCSGVWVSADKILTAGHCVADDGVGDRVFYVVRKDVYDDGSPREKTMTYVRVAKMAKLDTKHDLGLIVAVDAPQHEIARLSEDPPEQGMFAQTMGTPLGLWWSYSSGPIAAIRELELGKDMDPNMLWIQATTPISPGNSGCGLFDARGNLIGIASRVFVRGQNLNFFVHKKHVEDFLR